MNHRKFAAAAIACSAIAVAVPAALATPAPRQHPAYTDPSGDAASPTGLHAQIPSADIIGQDVSIDSGNLIVSTRVAGARKLLAKADGIHASFVLGDTGGVVSMASDTSSSATLWIFCDQTDSSCDDVPFYRVSGTAVLNTTTHTLTATYPLADSGLVVSADTVVSAATGSTTLGSLDDSPLVDSSSIAPGATFTLGG